MNSNFVSVIIPVFNGQQYLNESIESVLLQKGVSLELIIVDDGSTDGTKEVVSTYENNNIVRYEYQENQGLAASRNKGISLAAGNFIAFNDADDIWVEGKLSAQMAIMESQPGVEMISGSVRQFISPEIPEIEHAKYTFSDVDIQANLIPCLLFRSEVFIKYGMFDTNLKIGQDMSWLLQAKNKGLIIHPMPKLVYYRRLHPNNIGRIHQSLNYQARFQILKNSIDEKKRAGN